MDTIKEIKAMNRLILIPTEWRIRLTPINKSSMILKDTKIKDVTVSIKIIGDKWKIQAITKTMKITYIVILEKDLFKKCTRSSVFNYL